MTTISKPSYRHLLDADASPEELVIAYHERTKHSFHRYAASPGSMDWATQPDPFRRYPGADLVRLVLPKPGRPLPYWQLYGLGDMSSEPLSAASISLLFRYALSLTAWKRFHETTWSLRANPSSGNLHPTEGYAVLPAIDGLGSAPAVYHYAPREHALERRAILNAKAWTQLCAPFPFAPLALPSFTATTKQSAPGVSIDTFGLMGCPIAPFLLPSRAQVPTFRTGARIKVMPLVHRLPSEQ